MPVRPDELCQRIDILARAAAEIEDVGAGNIGGCDEAAAIIACRHIGVDARQRGAQFRPRRIGGVAGIGAQIGRTLQHLAVIIAAVLDIHAPVLLLSLIPASQIRSGGLHRHIATLGSVCHHRRFALRRQRAAARPGQVPLAPRHRQG